MRQLPCEGAGPVGFGLCGFNFYGDLTSEGLPQCLIPVV